MRIIFTTLARCWILIQTQSQKELSDLDSDEGPLKKHRRLTLDHWTAVSATMDRLKKEQTHRDVIKSGSRTRDVGVLCSERVPVNDKCIMVGTTGIAALKAEYGDDFTNFEIIQDVGYSSESSTHLSGDDIGTDQHFVRIYKYSKDNQPLNLRQELEAVAGLKNFHTLGSSLESSSSAAVSLNDSGLGTGGTPTAADSGDAVNHFRVEDVYEQDDLDYLETVLDECVDFDVNALSDPEELHFNISGIESDDPSDNFHNRSSFTTSAQMFYKMISVDSDNGEGESPTNENNISSLTNESEKTVNNNNTMNSTLEENNNNTKIASESDPETYKPIQDPTALSKDPQKSHRLFCSTPVRSPEDKNLTSHRHGLKRKRDHEAVDGTRMSNRVRSWLNRCSDFSTNPRKPTQRCSPDVHRQSIKSEDVSSCDASCECTSSSADEGNAYSSTSSFFEDDVFKQKTHVDSCSAEGSVETILHALLDPDFVLLPPPPSSSASYGSDSKNGSTVCCRKDRRRCKASSEGDLRERSSLKETSNLSSCHVIQKRNPQKQPTHSSHRLYSSLPNVLRHPSDSSTDENFIPSAQLSHSDTRTTACNPSSSSEVSRRRRRSRKKSSSSNRSNTSALLSSGDQGRQRSRTYTSPASRCGSRRRHRSQRSEFICAENAFSDEEARPLKVEIPVEENVGFDDLRRASSVLLSPVESDIVLTHLEEQSTVSDQVWDGYQEMPYLSEGYSEATVDEDAVRKLTEFGDDYGSAIGLPLRLLEPSGNNKGSKIDCTKSTKKSSKSTPAIQRLPSISADSDSDSEDLHYVIEEAGKALLFARAIFNRRQEGDPLSSADYAELLATCGTHLRCLQSICEHINIDGKEHSFSSSDLAQLHYLIDEWRDLRRSTEMFEKSEDPANHKYLKAQENIDALYNKMSHISSCSYLDIGSFTSWEDVHKNLSRLQMVLTSLQEAKEQLLAVNLQVHRFTTEYGSDANYKDSSLKSDITELYRQWEDVYEQNGDQLTELEGLKSDWESFDEKFRNLRLRVKEAEFNLNDDCDNICLTSTTNSTSLRQDFEQLKRNADSLENRLQGGEGWKKIDEDLQDLKRKIDRQDADIRRTTSLSVNHRNPSTVVEEDSDDHFEDAIQQLCEDDDHSGISPLKTEKTTIKSPKRRKSRFWRIVRVAVPVQLALVLLYCLACYLEPSCCNMLNNFNFSFTPQLRYFGTRPPV